MTSRLRLSLLPGIFVLTCVIFFTGCAGAPAKRDVSFLRVARDADASYQAGDLKAAQKKYELLLKANRTYATAYVRLGAIAYRQGNLRLARTYFQRAVGQDPANSQARYNLAMLSLNEARQLLSEYLRLAAPGPNRERTLVLLSQLNDFERKP